MWTTAVAYYYREGTQSSGKLICFHYLMKSWGILYWFFGSDVKRCSRTLDKIC